MPGGGHYALRRWSGRNVTAPSRADGLRVEVVSTAADEVRQELARLRPTSLSLNRKYGNRRQTSGGTRSPTTIGSMAFCLMRAVHATSSHRWPKGKRGPCCCCRSAECQRRHFRCRHRGTSAHPGCRGGAARTVPGLPPGARSAHPRCHAPSGPTVHLAVHARPRADLPRANV